MGAVVIDVCARPVLGSLRPAVRAVLVDLALDARWRADRLVAATSARLVAEHVAINVGTVASALRVLRDRGLVHLEQSTGPSGRFGLVVYALSLPAGIDVVASPRVAQPSTVAPGAAESQTATASSGRRRAGAVQVSDEGAQGALDLGLGNR